MEKAEGEGTGMVGAAVSRKKNEEEGRRRRETLPKN